MTINNKLYLKPGTLLRFTKTDKIYFLGPTTNGNNSRFLVPDELCIYLSSSSSSSFYDACTLFKPTTGQALLTNHAYLYWAFSIVLV